MSDLILRLTSKVASQAQELSSLSEALKKSKQEAIETNNKLQELSSLSSIKSSSSSFPKSSISHSKKTKEALIQEISNYEKKLMNKTNQMTKLISELGKDIIYHL